VPEPRQSVRTALLFVVVAFVVHWPALLYPYLQEDWEVIAPFADDSMATVLRYTFRPSAEVHYRPLVSLYVVAMSRLFGLDGLPSHAIMILLLAANGMVLVALITRLIGERRVAVPAALGYVAANVIHVDTLMIQTCGVENQLGALLFFGAALLFVRGRPVVAAGVYAIALTVKETSIILPAFCVLCVLFTEERPRWLAGARRVWPMIPILAAYLMLRFLSGSPLPADPRAPYHVSFVGTHLFTNLLQHLRWTAEALVPALPANAALGVVLLVAVAALAKARLRYALFFLAWYLLALAPMLVLPNHVYRYYLVFALPAALVAWWLAVWSLVPRLPVVVAAIAISVLASAGSFYLRHRERRDLDGSNFTLRNGAEVRRVWAFVAGLHLPAGATLLFDRINVWEFGKDWGPIMWTGDRSLTVYPARDLRWEGDRPVIVDSARDQGELYTGARNRAPIDLARTFVIGYHDDQLTIEPLTRHGRGD
jgi:hypothetical protein